MCDPITALAVTAVFASTAGTYMTVDAQRKQAGAQEKVAQNNATIATWQAEDAIERGKTAEYNLRRQGAEFKAKQKASLAVSGISLGSGSALETLGDTAEAIEYDALTLRHNAEREAWGLRNQASNFTAQASIFGSEKRANNAAFAGVTTGLTQGASLGAAGAFGGMGGTTTPTASKAK